MWYRIGTVAVTNGSKTVTGTGTLFVSNIKSGFVFLGPDFSTYEVDNITSDTVFTLKENYRGATASGASYAVYQTQSIIRDLTDKVTELLSNFNDRVTGAILNTLSTATNSAVIATDTIVVGIGKLQAQINSIGSTVRSTLLTGLSTATATAVTATDSVLSGIGKLQARTSLPAFSSYKSFNEAVTINTPTKLVCDVTEYATVPSTLSSSRFTPNVAGYYLVNAGVQFNASSSAQIILYKNGSSYKLMQFAASDSILMGSSQVYLNGTTDYVEVYVIYGSSGNVILAGQTVTYFQCAPLRAI